MDYLPTTGKFVQVHGHNLGFCIENGLQPKWGTFYGVKSNWTYMLSQNRARVLGFSWLRRCLNQRWMVRTSQSSCLDRPSSLFSSGCWQDKLKGPTHVRCSFHCSTNYTCIREYKHMHHLGYSSENLLENSVGLCFLWPVGLDLQAHRTWSCNKPAGKRSGHHSMINIKTDTVWFWVNYRWIIPI